MIDINQFNNIDLLVGVIVSANIVEGSSGLLNMNIDVGESETRTILSKIRKYYSPEEVVGKHCIVVANLQPRKIMEVESNGMVVCATYSTEEGEVVEIVEPPKNVPAGTRLS